MEEQKYILNDAQYLTEKVILYFSKNGSTGMVQKFI